LIRRATIADAAAIARLHVRASQWAYRGLMPDAHLAAQSVDAREAKWRALLADGSRHCFVAEQDARLLGFAECGPAEAEAGAGELYAIYLEPDVVGGGIGRALHDAALADLRSRGFSRAILWTLDGNVRAQRFYERAGWRPDGTTRDGVRAGQTQREIRYGCALDQ
jgi:GNAT superfamily N-acetyltransferase